MATTTISLTDEAYQRLKTLKKEGESFSDVVLRLTGAERDTMKGFGAWEDTDLESAVGEFHDSFNEDFDERQDAVSRR